MKQAQLLKSVILVLLVCLAALVQVQCAGKAGNEISNRVANRDSNNNQSQKSDDRGSKAWSLSSRQGGGYDGRCETITINSDGTIVFEDCREKTFATAETDNPQAFGEIRNLLSRLDLPNATEKPKDKKAECCDQVSSHFSIKLGDRSYYPDELNLTSAQTSDYEHLRAIYREVREKYENELRIRAAEQQNAQLTAKNAKALSIYATNEKSKSEWRGDFNRTGDTATFEGEWKKQKSSESVRHQLEVVQDGLVVKITRKEASNLPLPKEFQGYLESLMPGILKDRYPQMGIQWYAIFR